MKKLLKRFLPVILFVAAILLFTQISRFTNPASHAYAGECMSRSDLGRTFTNTCEFEINVGMCLADGDAEDYSNCPNQLLSAGASYTLPEEASFEIDAYGNNRIWACKAPFVFKMKPGNSNRALLRKGCARPLKH
ncbi:MAG: hypothetical protein CMK07_06635 [Ponticaulis sp.]|nr:hypothetical protein [Ponticaulis sp.]